LLRVSTLSIDETGIRRAVRAWIVEAGTDAANISIAGCILATIHIHLKLGANRTLAKEVFATVVASAATTFFIKARRSSAVGRKSLVDITRASIAEIVSGALRSRLYAAFVGRAT
jgi:hypothetical protein